MRFWIKKFRISAALDQERHPPEQRRMPRRSSPEMAEFEVALKRLDRRLGSERPEQVVPDGLHASIMRRIERAAGELEEAPATTRFSWQWLAVPAAASVLVFAAWLAVRTGPSGTAKPIPEHNQQVALAASELSLEISPESLKPAAQAFEPMDREMKLLRRDCERALRLAMASLPGDLTLLAGNAAKDERR